MKLRNKKTGEIVYATMMASYGGGELQIRYYPVNNAESTHFKEYRSISELNSDWEDYEEPKEYWFINSCGVVEVRAEEEQPAVADMHKQFGNYFETEEEAEQTVEKLKALKRLKDNGFEFEGWTIDDGLRISICTNFDSDGIYDEDRKEAKKDLDICFGGEE